MNENEFDLNEFVSEMLDDYKYVSDYEDHYSQWSDVGAESMKAFIENLDGFQLDEVVEYFIDYIQKEYDKGIEYHSKALGIRESLCMALHDMYDYNYSLVAYFIKMSAEEYEEAIENDDVTDQDIAIMKYLDFVKENLEAVKAISLKDDVQEYLDSLEEEEE